MKRLLLTILTGSLLFGAYVVYAQTVSPMIARPERKHADAGATGRAETSPTDGVQGDRGTDFAKTRNPALGMARKHFPGIDWVTRAQWVLKTDKAVIFTQEWKHGDSKEKVIFSPFAMIMTMKDSDKDDEKESQPITMIADSAQIEFSNEFDFSDVDPGRIVSAQLEREVTFNGPKGLSIDARTLIFSETARRIWSDHPVSFEFDGHKGTADRGLQIELIPNKRNLLSDQFAFSGVREFQLRNNVMMDVRIDKDPLAAPAQITCRGGFRFAFPQTDEPSEPYVATYENTVHIMRTDDEGNLETLDCHSLDLFFVNQSEFMKRRKSSVSSNGTASLSADELAVAENDGAKKSDDQLGRMSDLEFSHMIAREGMLQLHTAGQLRPKKIHQPVLFSSQKSRMNARMKRFEYNAATQIATMSSANGVHVVQKSDELRSQNIIVQHDEDGFVQEVTCRGRGQLLHRDRKSKEVMLTAQWQKELRKYHDAAAKLDVIEIRGDAMAHQPDQQTGIGAEFIKIWFDPQEEGLSLRSSDDSDRDDALKKARPRRLLAMENVSMVSPRMQARTDRLETWFEAKTDGSNGNAIDPFLASNQKKHDPFELRNDGKDKEEAPLEINAKLMRVRVSIDHESGKSELSEVIATGDVSITQNHEPGEKPLDLRGTRLHMQGGATNQQVLHVQGSPAIVSDRGLDLKGRNIFFDRRRNDTWIEGTGTLVLPVDQDLDGRKLEKTEELIIEWNSRMSFNGLNAEFEGDVRAKVDHTTMSCQRMKVVMNKKLDFSANRIEQKDVDIRHIVCDGGVKFDSSVYEEQQLVSIRRAEIPSLSIDRTSGKSVATGPGHAISWSPGRGKRARLTPDSVAAANQPLSTEQTGWEYSRIEFMGRMEGNLNDHFGTFHDRVHIVHGPVEQPLDVLDPDDLPQDGVSLKCNQMEVAQATAEDSKEKYIQVVARGNARLDGREFTGRADQISYDESKEMYLLRSPGDRLATIWRQESAGSEYSRADARSMKFIPSRKFLEIDQATRVNALK